MSVMNSFSVQRLSPEGRAKLAADGVSPDWDVVYASPQWIAAGAAGVPNTPVPGKPYLIYETQPGNVGVPDPAQVTANPAIDSPVVSATSTPGAVTAAANPAGLANSVATLFSNVTAAVPQVGSLNGIYFAALLYLAWHLYTHHHHYKLALAVVGLDVYLAYFRTIAPAATVTA